MESISSRSSWSPGLREAKTPINHSIVSVSRPRRRWKPERRVGVGNRGRRRPPAIRTSLRVGQPPPGDRQGIRRGRIRGRRRRARRDLVRPRRKDEDGDGPRLAPLRQRIESIFWTCKDILALERHGARTLRGLRVRIAARFLALAAAVSLNHELGRPSRALVDYVT